VKYILITLMATFLFGCSTNNKNTATNNQNTNDIVTKKSEAYKLMKQYCYICHMPQSKESMIAPPLIRVKEHYKPVYKTKSEFVNAVVKWATKPVEEDALMPGAVRKFECMPPQAHIPKDTLIQIAEYIFDNEMETPRFWSKIHEGNNQTVLNTGENRKRKEGGNAMRNSRSQDGTQSQLQLNDGAKWKVSPNVLSTMDDVKKLLNDFKGKSIEDYHKLGKDIFNSSKRILLNKENKGEIWDQLHTFFNKMEEDMHSLMSVKSIEAGEILKENVNRKVEKFGDFFE